MIDPASLTIVRLIEPEAADHTDAGFAGAVYSRKRIMADDQALPTHSWFQHERVHPFITLVREPRVHGFFQANIWLIEGESKDLVIDFGMGLASLSDHLSRLTDKPLIACATHAHVDHVGSFHEFEERLGPAIEAESFATMPDEATLANLFRELSEPVQALPYPGWDKMNYRVKEAPLSAELGDGDTLDIGTFRFTVLHLPGHSPGSIGLYDPARRVLLSGDAIYAGTLVDNVNGSDRHDYVATMKRLLTLEVEMVYPGHNRPFGGEMLRKIASDYITSHGT